MDIQQNMENLRYFNFYNIWVQVSSLNSEVLDLLQKDFSFFWVENPGEKRMFLKLEIVFEQPSKDLIPQKEALRQSGSCVTYEHNGKRFNDYYGKALGIYDFELEKGQILSEHLNYLHEISYLLILSRVGKTLDLKGLHRIHAFGAFKNNNALIGILPSKGGKSTLFMELCKDASVEIISDDSPLADYRGNLYPFPIRIGLEELSKSKFIEFGLNNFEKNVYSIERRVHGRKALISLSAFNNQIFNKESKNPRVNIFKSRRLNANDCIIKPVPKIAMLIPVLVNQVIGVGLPIIIEYFWEEGVEDFIRKSKIAIKRFISGIALLVQSKTFEIQLGTDPEVNARKINDYFFKN